ncbi:MAG: hypothetical protein ABIK43_02800 [candidate division WOR-3 bacterium]
MNLKARVIVTGFAIAGICLGFGGFGAGLWFPRFAGLNRRLTELNREWSGIGSFRYSPPLLTIGGHGAGEIAGITLGGWGDATVRQEQADSLGSTMAALFGGFEAGYPYSPVEPFWVRPLLDVDLGVWFVDAHSLEDGGSNFYRWFLGWQMGLTPAVEIMGRIRTSPDSYMGLFVKTGYTLPFMETQWSGSAGRPDFQMKGLNIRLGLRFGRTVIRPFRV